MRPLLALITAAFLIAVCACTPGSVTAPKATEVSLANWRDDELTRLTALQLHQALVAGEVTAEQVTGAFLERIERIDPTYNAIIEVNPDALAIARELDRKLARGEVPGRLHGLPVVLKANIDTADSMATSAGSVALKDHHASEDAFLVTRLRQAGAVILAKTNLSEWANFRSSKSTSGWSSLGGQTANAYDHKRNPCGSSSGSAVAVALRLAPLAVGTETDGSIVCPAGVNGVVGLKPSIGRISRHGIIPIAQSQDTAGPFARNASDAALLMRAMDGYDPRDRTTRTLGKKYPIIPPTPNANMQHIRIGVWRGYSGAGAYPELDRLLDKQVALLREMGAQVIDPVELEIGDIGNLSKQVLLHEFKHGINQYLAGTKLPPERRTLAGLIAFNNQHADQVMPYFGQEIFILAQASGDLTSAAYTSALIQARNEANLQVAGALSRHSLEAIVSVTNGPAWVTNYVDGDRFEAGSSTLPAVSGHPHLTLPMGMINGLPVGLSIMAHRNGEHRVLQIAYSLEEVSDPVPEPAELSGH